MRRAYISAAILLAACGSRSDLDADSRADARAKDGSSVDQAISEAGDGEHLDASQDQAKPVDESSDHDVGPADAQADRDTGFIDVSTDGDAGAIDASIDRDSGPSDASVDRYSGPNDASIDRDGSPVDSSVDRAEGSLDVSVEVDGGSVDASSEKNASGDALDDGREADASACHSWTYWSDGLFGGQVDEVRFDPRSPGVAFAVAGYQLYRSTDSGLNWTLLSGNTGATITELAFPPGDPGILLASTTNGFRRSVDGGGTWITRSLDGVSLTTLLVDRNQPQRIFVGGDQGFLMRSSDGGGTWRAASSGVPFGQVTSLAGDPNNPDNVLATVILEDANGAGTGSGAVARSTNGGMSWSTVLDVNGFAQRLSQCEADPRVVFAGTAIGISKSTDSGVTWGPFTLAGAAAADIGIDAANCDHVYAAIFPSGIAHSTNGGATWSAPITNGLTLQAGFQFASRLEVDPMNGANVVAATHNGIFRTTNGGDAWSESTGLASVSCRGLAVSPTSPQQLWMASWGSGAWHRPSPSLPWQPVPLDSLPRQWLFTVYPDTFVNGRLMAGAFLGGSDAWRSTDNGISFNVTNASTLNPVVFATDPTNTSVMYMGTQIGGIYKSLDGGATWQPSNTGAIDAYVLSILIDPTDSRTIYIGTQAQGILRSTDGGVSWNPTAMGLGVGGVESLVRFGTALYAWVDGGGVYRSSDGMSWAPSNAGLQALTVGGITVDPVVPRLFAGAGSDVYTSSDGSSWVPLETGCPPPTGGGRPLIVTEGNVRYLVLGAGTSGAIAHSL